MIAVVQATGDERLDQCFTRIFRQWLDSLLELAYSADRLLVLNMYSHICSLNVNLHQISQIRCRLHQIRCLKGTVEWTANG